MAQQRESVIRELLNLERYMAERPAVPASVLDVAVGRYIILSNITGSIRAQPG